MSDRWDVERAILHSNVDSRGRLIVLALLAKVDNDTAVTKPEHTPAFATLAAMTGLSKAVLSEWMQALEDGGWVERSKPGKGGRGNRTVYRLRPGADRIARRSRDLRVPRPKKNGSPSEPFSDETVRPANASEAVNSSPSEPFENAKQFAQRTL
jgi:DNA-binding MarR family transcriptional regulator